MSLSSIINWKNTYLFMIKLFFSFVKINSFEGSRQQQKKNRDNFMCTCLCSRERKFLMLKFFYKLKIAKSFLYYTKERSIEIFSFANKEEETSAQDLNVKILFINTRFLIKMTTKEIQWAHKVIRFKVMDTFFKRKSIF